MAKSRRRGAGEGDIHKRSDGRWEARLEIGIDDQGHRKRRSVYGRTRKEVADKLTKLRADQLEGLPLLEPTKLKFGTYLDEWLKSISRPRTRASTHQEYTRLVGHAKKHLAGVTLPKLNALHLESLHAALEDAKVGDRTRQAVHRVIRLALADAQRRGLIRVNVADVIDGPRVRRKPIRVLDADELGALLAAAAGRRIEALVVLLAGTGLRIGEALALRWRDFDLDEGRLRVERSLSEVGGEISFTEPKSAASKRTMGLSPSVVEALRTHRAALGAAPHPRRLVFASGNGSPWRKSNLLRREWHPLLVAAGLPQLGFHALRHTHATTLLASGANPRAVAGRLGHSRPSLVLDVYGHLLPGADDEITQASELALTHRRNKAIEA